MNRILGTLAALAALSTASCGGDDPEFVVVEDTGLLTVLWSIDGSVDPAICDVYAVNAFELAVYDGFGGLITTAVAPCESFGVSVELVPSTYDATATLLGFAGEPISVTEPVENATIFSNSELVVEVDFPAGAIY